MSTYYLKILALITMIIDHIGFVFFPTHYVFRYIGRLAFPIYAFLIAEGIKKTGNIKLYIRRLIIFALMSEVFYDLCFNSNINFLDRTNTLYTLSIATISIYLFNIIKNQNLKILSIVFVILTNFLNYDYGILGVILIYIFYFCNNRKLQLLLGFIWTTVKFSSPLYEILFYNNSIIYSNNNHFIWLYIFTLFPFFIIYFYNNKKGKSLKWIFYIAYPLHLLLIFIFKEVL